jgi:hypothetical protein
VEVEGRTAKPTAAVTSCRPRAFTRACIRRATREPRRRDPGAPSHQSFLRCFSKKSSAFVQKSACA